MDRVSILHELMEMVCSRRYEYYLLVISEGQFGFFYRYVPITSDLQFGPKMIIIKMINGTWESFDYQKVIRIIGSARSMWHIESKSSD